MRSKMYRGKKDIVKKITLTCNPTTSKVTSNVLMIFIPLLLYIIRITLYVISQAAFLITHHYTISILR